MSAADDTRTEIAAVLAGHHCRMHKRGPIECWSTLDDQECGLRFTTGGQYRAHVAEVLAEYVATKQAEAVTEVAREWQFGGWTILSSPPPAGSIKALALGQRVSDWLRDRADRIAP